MPLSSLSIGWIAGIIEGEGCFGYTSTTPTITLTSTDKDVVERLSNLLGGRIATRTSHQKKNPHHKIQYVIRWNGKRAIAIMMTILPLLLERRSQKAIECIQKWKTKIPRAIKKAPEMKIDNTVARINVSLTKEAQDELFRLRNILEQETEKRLPLAEVVRQAIRIALNNN